MYISSRLTDSEYAAGKALESCRERPNTHFDDCLHLAVSMRSFRAENVSAFVKALLDCEKQQAREAFANSPDRYPIAVTRDLNRGQTVDSRSCQRIRAFRAGRIIESSAAEATRD